MNQPINKDAMRHEEKEQQGVQGNNTESANKSDIKKGLPDQQEGSMNNGELGANFDEEAKKLNAGDSEKR